VKNKKPNKFFICCCDHRITPHSFASTEKNDLFILRNIGNIIPPYQSSKTSVAAAIEYAISTREITQIIVCGHSDCGGMKAVFAGIKGGALENWLQHAAPKKDLSSPDELSKVNVAKQIENLSSYPEVAKKLDEKKLIVNGWWLNLDSNEMWIKSTCRSIYNKEEKNWSKLFKAPS